MEKIEIGEYVRTKSGIIDKVIIDYFGICNSPNCNCKHVSCQYDYYDEEDIVKHSKDIIDLLEVGDYVNGHKINHITNITDDEYEIYEEDECYAKKGIYLECGDEEGCIIIESNNIKSILTKEIYEQNCYKMEV